jgi:3-oxoacyl-[acyl-carrier-protein] synthase-3
MSRVLDWQDRGTCILFGDGAGAVVLRASTQEGGILSSVLRSDGGGADLLCIPTNNVRDLNGHKIQKMFMVGSEVFKFATRVVDESIREACEIAGIELDDIDLIVPHQANLRILQSAARKLKIDIERFMSNVDRYGNTSAASIPIALCEAIEAGRVKDDDYLVFVGFGGGLSWASMVLQWGAPEPEHQATRLGQQRRQLSYILARLRNRVNKIRRGFSQFFNRIRPDQGRIFRLRRKLDREDIS